MDEDLVAYYAPGREAERLTDVNPLERVRTELLLERCLPARRSALLRAIERVQAAPSLLGASPHLLALATAP